MAGGKIVQRTCLGCRTSKAQEQLVRFVLGPDKRVYVDYRQKLPGRGAYSCLTRACLEKTCKGGQLARAFKANGLKVELEEVVSQLGQQLLAKVTSLVGMVRKSRQYVGGSQQVVAELGGRQEFGLVLLATDVSPGVGEKVQRKADALGVTLFRVLNKEQLGQLTGRAERSALAVHAGLLCESLRQELFRYMDIVGEF